MWWLNPFMLVWTVWKLYCFWCFFRAPGLAFFKVDLMKMQMWTVATFALKQCVSWKIHQIQRQKSTNPLLIDILPACLFHNKVYFNQKFKYCIDMNGGFIQSLLRDLWRLCSEVKIWLSKPLSALLVPPHCTSYLSWCHWWQIDTPDPTAS